MLQTDLSTALLTIRATSVTLQMGLRSRKSANLERIELGVSNKPIHCGQHNESLFSLFLALHL